MDYKIEDFTIDRYIQFLEKAKTRFAFASFDDIPENQPHILLRHDLDLSVDAGYQVAVAEHDRGISTTYFVQLHSPFYNLMELKSFNLIKKILALNHKIGLHFDSHFYDISDEKELIEKLSFEEELVNKLFDINIKVFSFHLTNAFTIQSKKFRYGNLINAYSDLFQTQYEYCSDSYGIWRYKRLFDFIENTTSTRLQILTHPEWWIHDVAMPATRIKNIIDQKVAELNLDADQNYIYKENSK